jgi:hypothetical protein
MLQNLKIGLKYWKIWKIIILAIEEDQKPSNTRKMYLSNNKPIWEKITT